MALRRFMLLMIVLVISPITFAARFHGFNSYKQYHNYINGGRSGDSNSEEIAESYQDRNDINKGINSRYAGNSKYANLESSFVFPGDELRARNGDAINMRIEQDATRCDRQTFCEDVPNYPEEFVNQALARNSSLLHYARQDIINVSPRVDTNEETLCLSQERLITPRTAVNAEDKWLYILQSNHSKFYQTVRIEICREENEKCRIVDDFAEGYITSCNQKYIFHELLAISDDGKRIVKDHFQFPASCCCHVRFNGDSAIRTRI